MYSLISVLKHLASPLQGHHIDMHNWYVSSFFKWDSLKGRLCCVQILSLEQICCLQSSSHENGDKYFSK